MNNIYQSIIPGNFLQTNFLYLLSCKTSQFCHGILKYVKDWSFQSMRMFVGYKINAKRTCSYMYLGYLTLSKISELLDCLKDCTNIVFPIY